MLKRCLTIVFLLFTGFTAKTQAAVIQVDGSLLNSIIGAAGQSTTVNDSFNLGSALKADGLGGGAYAITGAELSLQFAPVATDKSVTVQSTSTVTGYRRSGCRTAIC